MRRLLPLNLPVAWAAALLALWAPGPSAALAQGQVRPAGSLAVARSGHTATLLQDGRVLVVGGRGTDQLSELAGVEWWDPKSSRWKKGPPLSTGRSGHTATLLPDGRVLVTGGTTHDTTDGQERFLALASAELFDPKKNTWSGAPPMQQARHWHTATLLPDGRVLVTGGAREARSHLASSELFDPKANQWTQAASLATARCLHRAVLLADGAVMVVGGRSNQPEGGQGFGKAVASTERYEPAGNVWSPGPELQDPRQYHAALLLADGRVAVIGGATASTMTNLTELWRPGAEAWALAEHSLSKALLAHTATALSSGEVLVVGGEPYDAVDTARAQRFNPKTESWCLAGSLKTSRKNHTATALADGRVLVVGGTAAGIAEGTAELWQTAPGKCEEPPGASLDPF